MLRAIRQILRNLFLLWKSSSKLRLLSSIPTGLKVTHTPNPAKAQIGGTNGYPYTWLYATTIESLLGVVSIEEFGAFSWYRGRWYFTNFTGKPFTRDNFIEWYSCPRGIVLPECQYTDFQNWSGSVQLINKKAKWYFIGKDENGRRVKGEAEIVELGELIG